MMKCQLVIVPAKHPHLRGEGGREDGGGRELTGREMTPWILPSHSFIQFIFLSLFSSYFPAAVVATGLEHMHLYF